MDLDLALVNNYLSKVRIRKTRTMYEICSKLTVKTLEVSNYLGIIPRKLIDCFLHNGNFGV